MTRHPTGSLRALGERIRNLRDFRGWSRQTLADRLGVDAAFLRSIERGELDLPLSTIEDLADCFEVPIGELLLDVDRL